MQRYSVEELQAFEQDIAEEFNAAKIKAPVHLYDGNEEQMISFFERNNISEDDWVLCSWRSHYQCLLKGVPKEELKQAILEGRSISLCFEKYKVLCSGIVTGSIPIAVGIAMQLYMTGSPGRVFCFMGDMTSESGIAHECIKYSNNNNLPIHFIIEDNGKSVCTDTSKAWGGSQGSFEWIDKPNVTYYKYDGSKWPHAGAGSRVQF